MNLLSALISHLHHLLLRKTDFYQIQELMVYQQAHNIFLDLKFFDRSSLKLTKAFIVLTRTDYIQIQNDHNLHRQPHI
jgi:hypothetical protein